MGRVFTYICGDAGPADEYNPLTVTYREPAPELLFHLHAEPLSLDELSRRLGLSIDVVKKTLEDLSGVNAVVEKEGKWHVSFPIFTREDIHLIYEKTRKPALKLAEKIMVLESRLREQLAKLSCAKQVEINKLTFAVVGCFILDWKGLEILNERDLTLCGRKLQPGGRRYVLLGKEEGAGKGLKDKMYWGSHNSTYGRFTFTSFGDHTGYRYTFPDVVWSIFPSHIGELKLPDNLYKQILSVFNLSTSLFMINVGNVLLAINETGSIPKPLLAEKLGLHKELFEQLLNALAEMKYVSIQGENVKLNYPVFTTSDKDVIESISAELSPIVEKEACEYFNSLHGELGGLTSLRRGIDPREIYTEIWHWIFGWANRVMAERGFMYDPPKVREGEGRYIAWVTEESLMVKLISSGAELSSGAEPWLCSI